jgi:hypothetical protein
MTADELRLWVVTWSAVCAILTFVVFLAAPVILPLFGITMEWDQAWKLLQIAFPVMAGYVASAAAYATGQTQGQAAGDPPSPLLVRIAKGSFHVYLFLFVCVIIIFVVSNRPSGPRGSGMSIDALATWLSGLLAALTVITNGLILWLFGRAR